MNEIFAQNNLNKIEAHVWELLVQSVNSSKTPFHQGCVATVNNNIPEQRMVVLRGADAVEKTLSFNTDIRSIKIEHLAVNNTISWLFYDTKLKVQLRMYAHAQVHFEDEVSKIAWQNTRLASKICYTTQAKPGSLIPTPELIDVNQQEVSEDLLVFAENNFAVIETQIYALDFVFLNREGNRRAFFDYQHNSFQWKQV
jgi:pyridoxamine 5'-phosphate oxidase